MNPNLDKFIAEHFPGVSPRSAGTRAFDAPGTIYPEDSLRALYQLGAASRDDEVRFLTIENKALNDVLKRTQTFEMRFAPTSFTIHWWIGLLIGTIAAAHFYFTYLR
jgi:hypothetical protein